MVTSHRRGAPGSRSNPIHPALDSFMARLARNGLRKRIAILIRNAELPAVLSDLLHTLNRYCENCDLQLVVMLPSGSELPVLSVI